MTNRSHAQHTPVCTATHAYSTVSTQSKFHLHNYIALTYCRCRVVRSVLFERPTTRYMTTPSHIASDCSAVHPRDHLLSPTCTAYLARVMAKASVIPFPSASDDSGPVRYCHVDASGHVHATAETMSRVVSHSNIKSVDPSDICAGLKVHPLDLVARLLRHTYIFSFVSHIFIGVDSLDLDWVSSPCSSRLGDFVIDQSAPHTFRSFVSPRASVRL